MNADALTVGPADRARGGTPARAQPALGRAMWRARRAAAGSEQSEEL